MRVALVLMALAVLAVASPAWATFPGRNGLVAFSAYSLSEESSDIVIRDTFVGVAKAPGGPRHIFAEGLGPAFSPDGRRIAYGEYHPGRGIWLTRPACRWREARPDPPPCSRQRRVTRGWDDSPAWSPNGKRIAFVRRGSMIYTVRASGGDREFVAKGYDPDWSSKGVLAFTEPDEVGIRLREPDGRFRVLTVTGAHPSWSPAGDRVAFTAYDAESGRFALYAINVDGSGLRKLWAPRNLDNEPLSPTWSPDGRSIAFVKGIGGGYTGAVYVVRPDGQGLRMLMPALPDCRLCFKGLQFQAIAWQARG